MPHRKWEPLRQLGNVVVVIEKKLKQHRQKLKQDVKTFQRRVIGVYRYRSRSQRWCFRFSTFCLRRIRKLLTTKTRRKMLKEEADISKKAELQMWTLSCTTIINIFDPKYLWFLLNVLLYLQNFKDHVPVSYDKFHQSLMEIWELPWMCLKIITQNLKGQEWLNYKSIEITLLLKLLLLPFLPGCQFPSRLLKGKSKTKLPR